MEVKNNYAYNIPQEIYNKFIEVKIFVGWFLGQIDYCTIEHPWIINPWIYTNPYV